MKAGTLRHRVTIEQFTGGNQDAYGEEIVRTDDSDWSVVATRWASSLATQRPQSPSKGDCDARRNRIYPT